ncbi:MAG: sensor histidine kinase [Lachnospiraceae bacterium]|nr:sensor histidine kinase [Lachnospiraceae bacterium]
MKKELSLRNKMALSYSLLVFLILAITMGFLWFQRTDAITDNIDKTISGLSYTLANDPAIVKAVKEENMTGQLSGYLTDLCKNVDHVDYIVVVNKEDIRLYHLEKDKIGQHFQGGDEKKALEGADTYVTEGKGSREFQRRAFSSVYNEEGECVGFVMVSSYVKQIQKMKQDEFIHFVLLFALALTIGILFAIIIAESIKKSLLGYDPHQFTEMFLQREEILDDLEEGIALINVEGVCEYTNQSARNFYKIKEEDQIRQAIQTLMKDTLSFDCQNGKNIYNRKVRLGDTSILVDAAPIEEKGKRLGTLIIFKDRTEMMRLAEELTGVQHIIAALRATTHEHKNAMHVILGLLQTGETKMAMEYIDSEVTRESTEENFVLERIKNKTIAALIIGKRNRAKELNIRFQLLKESYLEAHNPYLSANDLVTVIGNLIENAFDAIGKKEDIREVNLFILSDENALTIIVDDTGEGMDNQTIEKIRNERYTTKGEGHGVGMTLIRQIVYGSGGLIQVESEPGEGSSFTISINQPRERRKVEETGGKKS